MKIFQKYSKILDQKKNDEAKNKLIKQNPH